LFQKEDEGEQKAAEIDDLVAEHKKLFGVVRPGKLECKSSLDMYVRGRVVVASPSESVKSEHSLKVQV
jgi:hypothetical protein